MRIAAIVETERRQLPRDTVARLQDRGRQYADWVCQSSKSLFGVGDLITPRRDAPLHGHGYPHIVIEVMRPGGYPPQPFASDQSGARHDLRILFLGSDGETIGSAWVEAHWYQAWTQDLLDLVERPTEGSA